MLAHKSMLAVSLSVHTESCCLRHQFDPCHNYETEEDDGKSVFVVTYSDGDVDHDYDCENAAMQLRQIQS